MPVTINGIGTRYSGSRNSSSRQGVCRSCGKPATLTSYDTTLYFVIIFIPVIPLGTKHIVDQCSRCRRHYVVSQAVFLEARAKDYAQAETLMAGTPDEATVAKALHLVISYGEQATIDRYIARAEALYPNSPDLHVFVSDVHRKQGQYARSEASLRRALELRDTVETREGVAEYEFARGDIDAGRKTIEPLLAVDAPRPSNAVRLGVTALQAKGRHQEALELMNRVRVTDTTPAGAKEFARLRALSERTLERSTVDPARFITDEGGKVVLRKRGKFVKTKLAVAAVGALALVYFGYSVFLGTSRRIYLVSGLARAYTVRVDGTNYTLQPHQTMPIRASEGAVSIDIIDPAFTGPKHQTFSVTSSVLVRPFDGQTAVLNPDGMAAVMSDVAQYGPRGSLSPVEPTMHSGQIGYVLPHADYAFENPPGSVTTQNNEPVTYTVLYVETDATPMSMLGRLERHKETAAEQAYAHRVLEWPIDDAESAEGAAEIVGDSAVDLLKPRLAIRPVEVQAHRAYQDLMRNANNGGTLVADYRAMLAKEPENGSLKYLVARVLDDSSDTTEAIALFQAAEQSKPPEPMAFVGEAYLASAVGDYARALQLTRSARSLMPDRKDLILSEWEALFATSRYTEALAVLPSENELDREPLLARIETLTAMSRSDEITSLLTRRKDRITQLGSAEAAEKDLQLLSAQAGYARHDERTFAKAIRDSSESPEALFCAAICERDFAAAEKFRADSGRLDVASMLLYIAADSTGRDSAAAERYLRQAISSVNLQPPPFNALGSWLSGKVVPTEADLRNWSVPPNYKAIAFTALGAARPELRSICYGLCRTFDYRLMYPHELLVASRAKSRAS